MVGDITLQPIGVVDPHLRSQEHPPGSGKVPDKCSGLSFAGLGIERNVNMFGNITFKLLGDADLHLRSQEDSPMSGRISDKCPDLYFLLWT